MPSEMMTPSEALESLEPFARIALRQAKEWPGCADAVTVDPKAARGTTLGECRALIRALSVLRAALEPFAALEKWLRLEDSNQIDIWQAVVYERRTNGEYPEP